MNFRELDRDGDGSVSREEFEAGPFVQKMPEEQRRAMFDRLDADGDGGVSPTELRESFRKRSPRDPKRPQPKK
jgi:Ca2+-binding EF-hand superfamily protein